MLRALDARRIIIGNNRAGNERIILDVGINRDNGNLRGASKFKGGFDLQPIDGVHKNQFDAVSNQSANFLNLLVDAQRGVARNQNIAVIFDRRANFLVNDLVKGIVQRHVNRAELAAMFVLSEGIIGCDEVPKARRQQRKPDCRRQNFPHSNHPQCTIPQKSLKGNLEALPFW